MADVQIPSEVDIRTYEGLTLLFRFGIRLRDCLTTRTALDRLEARFKLTSYEPVMQGALEDTVRHLDQLGDNERFRKVCDLINAASDPKTLIDGDIRSDLLRISAASDIVRFSFAPAILPCLLLAQSSRIKMANSHDVYAIRYSGVGSDVTLMAFASLFLGLPVYTETNPPWNPDTLFDDDEPNTEPPDIEITFPPADFRAEDAPHLENSVRKSQLPRAVDRGKYDLESVMLEFLNNAPSSALAFVSQNFTSSTRQSRLKTRQNLVDSERISRVAELATATPPMTLIELDRMDERHDTIRMVSTDLIERFTGAMSNGREIRGQSEIVTVKNIAVAGYPLVPTRYLSVGPTGGGSIGAVFQNKTSPSKYRLIDLFEIIRPKLTKDDPNGKQEIHELGASNISENGFINNVSRELKVPLYKDLAIQKIKSSDILFVHKGPIGRVGFSTDADVADRSIWASQSLFIIRPRSKPKREYPRPYCDPRLLFMYLLTPKVRESWKEVAIGDRSHAIPIGEIERFGLPENLLTSRRPTKNSDPNLIFDPDSPAAKLFAEFEVRQANLSKVRDLEMTMENGLDRFWNISWSVE